MLLGRNSDDEKYLATTCIHYRRGKTSVEYAENHSTGYIIVIPIIGNKSKYLIFLHYNNVDIIQIIYS